MSENTSLPIADIQKRIKSFIIDDIVVSIFLFIIFYEQVSTLLSGISVVDQSALNTVNSFIADNILIVLAIKVLYHTILVWQNGMTLGKYIMKIRVVELNREHTPTFSKAFLRAVIRLVSEVFFYLGFIMAFFVPKRQTLHDKLSNCVVIDA